MNEFFELTHDESSGVADLVLNQPARLNTMTPAFFVALLLHELRDGRSRAVAALGGAIALALVPIAPPGVPVLAASLAALVGLTSSARRVARERL